MKKAALVTASQNIMTLHKALLEFQKNVLETETGIKLNPYEALHAALNDERFTWLKFLSQMIVQLDIESDDLENPGRKSPPMDITQLKSFFSAPPSEFQEQLLKSIQEDPDISFLFSKAKQAVLSL